MGAVPLKMRTRFWIESGLSAGSLFLALLTTVWRDWIEIIFRVDPDHGDGSLEWVFVGALALSTVVFSLVARREFRRTRLAAA
jgi:hypothetical protein